MESTSALLAPPTLPNMPTHPQWRMWPAALTLVVLSPLVAEVMSGSTPPLLAIQPFALIFLPTLYGISVLLIHEIMACRRLGWGNALLLGAAFGVFQEALIVQTWFNFMSPASPSHSDTRYGVLWATKLDWAFNLTLYHAVVSITVPLILIALFFPRRALLPWLGPKRIVVLAAWMLLLCGALAVNVAFTQFAKDGYHGPPPIPYLASIVLTLLLLLLGIVARFPAPHHNLTRRAPRLWIVRLICCSLMVLFFLLSILLPATKMPIAAEMSLLALVFVWILWRVRSWSARAGWNERHLLSVAIGVIMYFVFVWGPIIEFGLRLPLRTGMTAVNLLVFVALLFFDQRLKRRLVRLAHAEARTPIDAAPPSDQRFDQLILRRTGQHAPADKPASSVAASVAPVGVKWARAHKIGCKPCGCSLDKLSVYGAVGTGIAPAPGGCGARGALSSVVLSCPTAP